MADGATALPTTPSSKKTPSKAGVKRGKADATDDEETYTPSKKKTRTPRSKMTSKSYKEASEESEAVKSDRSAEGEVEMEDGPAVRAESEEGEASESAHEPTAEEAEDA